MSVNRSKDWRGPQMIARWADKNPQVSPPHLLSPLQHPQGQSKTFLRENKVERPAITEEKGRHLSPVSGVCNVRVIAEWSEFHPILNRFSHFSLLNKRKTDPTVKIRWSSWNLTESEIWFSKYGLLKWFTKKPVRRESPADFIWAKSEVRSVVPSDLNNSRRSHFPRKIELKLIF